MGVKLYDYQKKAIDNMKNGCILCGGVGSGKSITSLAYYFFLNGGSLEPHIPMNDPPMDLYIITTARKRDTKEWDGDMAPFLLTTGSDGIYHHKVVVDSWNNIGKYKEVEGSFFIFDEQRVIGSGSWVKSFLTIAKHNKWILLSATPGDTWSDYIPVFIANGFYRNKTEFTREHIIYKPFNKYYQIDRYVNTGRLIRLRNSILVDMDYKKPSVQHHIDIYAEYEMFDYKHLLKTRFNIAKNEPIENASELCYELRKIVNSDSSRIDILYDIIKDKHKVIVFYNFDYELELISTMLDAYGIEYSQWNGHKHQPIPESDEWAYLVQYNAGAEGWNCIKTDTIIFYSQNYSYKVMVQASGRIDRLNTPYTDLYYYHIKSRSSIDLAISKALSQKKKFNETKFTSE